MLMKQPPAAACYRVGMPYLYFLWEKSLLSKQTQVKVQHRKEPPALVTYLSLWLWFSLQARNWSKRPSVWKDGAMHPPKVRWNCWDNIYISFTNKDTPVLSEFWYKPIQLVLQKFLCFHLLSLIALDNRPLHLIFPEIQMSDICLSHLWKIWTVY